MTFTRAFLLALIGFAPLYLFGEESSPISLSVQAGAGSASSSSGVAKVSPGTFHVGGRLGYELSDRWSVGAEISSYALQYDTSPAQDIRLSPLTAWVERDFPWTRLWTPYAIASIGVSRNKSDTFSNGVSNTGWTAGLSLGLKFRLSDLQDLSIEAGVRQFSRATADHHDITLAEGGMVLRFFLPESWVPMKQNVDISDADLEIPLVSDEPEVELDPMLLAQEELDLLQKEIVAKKMAPITFDAGSAILQTTSFEALDTLGTIFRRYPDVRVRIYGFADEGTPKETGEALAVARSQVVGTYVVKNFYLNEARFIFLGERPTPPAALRRIEFEAIPGR